MEMKISCRGGRGEELAAVENPTTHLVGNPEIGMFT
jgi:hypothetical protein